MNKKSLIAIIAVVIIIILIAVPIGTYNSLVSKQTKVEEESANIDTQLQRRVDLIPNLVKTVKKFTTHETEVFNSVEEARKALMSAGTIEDKAKANDEVTGALNKLIAIAEAYPDLKSDNVYIGLMDELAGTENRIAYARTNYNKAVTEYNIVIKKFPAMIIANMYGFSKADFFEGNEDVNIVPEVDFE